MAIETKRLVLIPLTESQMRGWLEDADALARSLSCAFCSTMSAQEAASVQKRLAGMAGDPENSIWHTIWLILRKEDRNVVGTLGFCGAPDEDGVVEIVFALEKGFEKKGFMTEAVRALCRWAKLQPDVYRIVARAELGNTKAQRVLINGGFLKDDPEDSEPWYLEAKS